MLRRLRIKNLAIVEDLELDLAEGLTVVTGETGAGKSILVDALALLAGGRGSSELIREGAERLTVSGEFDGVLFYSRSPMPLLASLRAHGWPVNDP